MYFNYNTEQSHSLGARSSALRLKDPHLFALAFICSCRGRSRKHLSAPTAVIHPNRQRAPPEVNMATSSSAVLEADGGGSSLSSAEQAALDADLYTLKCETGFAVMGLHQGEAAGAFVRVFCTLVTVSVVSAWVTRRDCINQLLLFFSHWLRCELLWQVPNVCDRHR